MIKINLRSGRTLSYDLNDPVGCEEWEKDFSDSKFQTQITGIGIIFNSHWYTLPLPRKFRQLSFHAELVESTKKDVPRDRKFIGERLRCYADDILISLLVYYGNRPKMCRVDIIKIGKRRFNPDIKVR